MKRQTTLSPHLKGRSFTDFWGRYAGQRSSLPFVQCWLDERQFDTRAEILRCNLAGALSRFVLQTIPAVKFLFLGEDGDKF